MVSTGSNSSAATPDTASTTVDLVIGVVSYNDTATIGPLLTDVREGVTRTLDGITSRIVLADGGSTDETVARARASLGHGMLEVSSPQTAADVLAMPYHGIPGKAGALRSVLVRASELKARACIVIDAGASTSAARRLEWLTKPVLAHEIDFVSPYYSRHPHQGALTKGIVYPLFRALYGVQLHQPAAAEFACSAPLIDYLLDEDLWDREGGDVGIDLWLTTSAAAGSFQLAEVVLGTRPHQTHGEDSVDLGTTLRQVVGSVFADFEQHIERWQRVRSSTPVRRFGELTLVAPAPDPGVDVEPLIESYRLGYRELRDVWTYVLPPRTIVELRRLTNGGSAGFRMDDDLWSRVIYDFALGYRMRALPRDHLFGSLVPLYLGWLASFILQANDRRLEAVDERVDELAAAFEKQKPYLISRWRWPERLRA